MGPFFSLEGDSSGQKSKLTRLLDLSCPGDGGSEKRNDFKPSKFYPPPLFLSTPIGSTIYRCYIYYQFSGPLSNVPSQPIILIASHRSPSPFLATDNMPPAPPLFYTESFLPLISSIIKFFNL